MRFFGFLLVLFMALGVHAEQELCTMSLTEADSNGFADTVPLEPAFDINNTTLQKFEAVRSKIDAYVNRTANSVRATTRLRDQKMARLNHDLSTGDSRHAIQMLGTLFYDTEKAYRLIEAGQQDPRNEKVLGENVTDYIYFRSFLERIISPEARTRNGKPYSEDYVRTAVKTLMQIGLISNEFGIAFDKTGLDKKRPELASIQKTYEQSEVAIARKLDVDLWAERFAALKAFASAMVFQKQIQSATATAYETLLNKVSFLRAPFKLVARSFRATVARDIDLPKIKQLVLNKQSTVKKLNILRSMWAADPDSTLLMSFMRFQDDEIRQTWKHLRDKAEKEKDNDIFSTKFWNAILKAENLADIYDEPISEYYEPSDINTLAKWVVAGSSFSMVLYHQLAPHTWPLWNSIDLLMTYLH